MARDSSARVLKVATKHEDRTGDTREERRKKETGRKGGKQEKKETVEDILHLK